jgi:uncharacterized DUF497 family protein
MGFEFDPLKAVINRRKHGVPLADAEGVFDDPLAVHIEDPDAEHEQRFVAIGTGNTGMALVVVYTYGADAVRVISARRASRKERSEYESTVRLLER